VEPHYNLLEAAQLRVLRARATLQAIGLGQRQQREKQQQQQQQDQTASRNEEEPNVLHVEAEHLHEGISNGEEAAKDREGSEGHGRRGDEEVGAHAIGRSSGGERDGRGCKRQGPAVLAELPQQSNGPEEQVTAQEFLGAEGSWRGRMQSRKNILQTNVESLAREGQEEDFKGKMAQIQQQRLELEASSSVLSSIGCDSGDSTSHHSEHLENFSSKRRTFSDFPPQRFQAPRNRPLCTPEKNDDNAHRTSQGEAGRLNFFKCVG
jgi:hypothetical protein